MFDSAKKLMVIGPPASGKRRISEFLSRRLGLEYVSMKDIVEGVSTTNFGADLKKTIPSGNLPPEVVERFIIARLREKDCRDKVKFSKPKPRSP
jgi:adenylate kinase family enzyme